MRKRCLGENEGKRQTNQNIKKRPPSEFKYTKQNKITSKRKLRKTETNWQESDVLKSMKKKTWQRRFKTKAKVTAVKRYEKNYNQVDRERRVRER